MAHRVSIGLTLATFFLILWGGIVHGTGSSLACPDWPLCYGSLFPPMTSQIAIEHSHRLLATLVGLTTIFLVLLLRKSRHDRSHLPLGLLALFLVILQGILGGVTVLLRLPTLVSTAHLAMSLLFLATLITIVHRTDPISSNGPLPRSPGGPLFTLATGLLFAQILIGALVRHTGAGLVCPEIPLCHGSLWPQAWITRLHMVHRVGGILVTLYFLYITTRLWHRNRVLRTSLVISCLLILLQIGLGVLSVVTLLGLPAVTAHLGIATALWANQVSMGERFR